VIVPANRLLVWFGIVVLPFAGLGAAVPEAALLSAGVVSAFVVLVVLDGLLSRRRLESVTVEFPETVRLTKDREGNIVFRASHGGSGTLRLRLGLAFPAELTPRDEEIVLAVPGKGLTSQYHWPLTPSRRGQYVFEACYGERSSSLGLWALRRSFPARFEVRVYPNLLVERKNLAALFLNRGAFGLHAQRQLGQGREFEKLREYVPGDGFDQIHWKATARRSRPITKVFQVERTQEVYVLVDASRLSARPAAAPESSGADRAETLLERFVTAALVMGVAAERQGDRFGLVTFSDGVHRFIRADSGRAHYNACRDALYRLHPRPVTPDFDELCSFIGLRLRRRALLVVLTNLDDPVLMDGFERSVDLLRRKHLVVVGMLRPRGLQPLFTDPRAESLDDVYAGLGGHILWHNLRELGRVLKRKGVRFSVLPNEEMCARLVAEYVTVKQRQLL
jgi:uncharacterized protein (DUF58 family)